MIRILDLSTCSHLYEQLIEIWQESFGDRKEYIQNFFKSNATYTKVVICEQEDLVVSATYLLPVSYIQKDGRMLDCYYLYAAATLPAYRGQGYLGQILQFVNEHINEPVILVPASTSLVDYYKRHGFMLWLTEKRTEAEDVASYGERKPISAKTYCDLRNQCLQKPGSMLWDGRMMSYICKEFQQSGGEFLEVNKGGSRVLLMCHKEQDTLRILEVLPDALVQPTVMANQPFFEEGVGYFNLTMG